MSEHVWYVANGANVTGPFPRDQLVERGGLTASSQVWRDGLADWVPAAQSEVADLLEGAGNRVPAPGTPAAPGVPAAPGTPAAPGVPAAPGTPAAPGVPAAPGTPAAPAPAAPGGSTFGWVGAPPGQAAMPPPHQQHWPETQLGRGSELRLYPNGGSSPWSVAAIVCGVIAVLFFPIIFGPLGIVFAGVGIARKEHRGMTGLWVAVGGMVVGFLLGIVLFATSL